MALRDAWLRWREARRRRRMGFRRIRPTLEGVVFLVTGTAVALAALNTGNNLLYLLLALLLGVLGLSGVLSEAAIRNARPVRWLPDRIHAGSPAAGRLRLHNPRSAWPHLAVVVQEVDAEGVRKGASAGFAVVPPGQERERPAEWTFDRRGLVRLHGLRVSTAWPFGILRKWYEVPVDDEVLVLPAALGDGQEAGAGSAGEGAWPRPAPHGADPLALRPWRPGEDRRGIHWRTSARRGRMVVVEREEERGHPLLVRVDSPPPGPRRERANRWEESLSRATASLLQAEQEAIAVDLDLAGRQLHSPSGRDHLPLLVELALAPLPPEDR